MLNWFSIILFGFVDCLSSKYCRVGFNEWYDVMKIEYRKVDFAMLRNIQAKAFIYVIVIHLASNPYPNYIKPSSTLQMRSRGCFLYTNNNKVSLSWYQIWFATWWLGMYMLEAWNYDFCSLMEIHCNITYWSSRFFSE